MNNFDNIPQEMKELPQWVARVDKFPINPNSLYGAKSTDKTNWGTFEQAKAAIGKKAKTKNIQGKECNGIGFVLSAPFCGIDIDHCINTQTGEITAEALDIIQTMESYTEISPSGTGVHIFYKNDGNTHKEWHKKKPIDEVQHLEMYQCDRYFTVTGKIYRNYNTLCERSERASLIYQAYMQDEQPPTGTDNTAEQPKQAAFKLTSEPLTDGEIIEKAMNAKNGAEFLSLWRGDTSKYNGDESRADLALCNMLAFWSSGNADTIDRLFRQSGLMRDKWDRATGQSTYGGITIDTALRNCKEYYNPTHRSDTALQDFKDCIQPSNSAAENNSLYTDNIEIKGFTYENIKSYTPDDIGTAEFFADLIKDFVCYIAPEKSFYIYNGVVWACDDIKDNLQTGKLLMKFVKVVQALIPPKPKGEPKYWTDEETAEERINSLYRQHYKNLGNANGRERVLKDVKKLLRKSPDIFDKRTELLNTKNCTLNLETGEIQPHNADDYITKCVNTDYIQGETNERFNSFINEICQNDTETIQALQRALGYSLMGTAHEECLFIAYGKTTRNGKGTLFDLVLDTLGSYGRQMGFETIARSGNIDGSKPTPDLAVLRGVRFILSNEPHKGVCFNEGLVKQMTGNDTMVARHLNCEPITFKCKGIIFVTANSLPSVADSSLYDSDRIKLLLFNKHFSEVERDTSLKKTLREGNGKAAVLNWLLEGYKQYRKYGLLTTAQAREALNQYRAENDYIQQFIDEGLILYDKDDRHAPSTKFLEVQREYSEWCRLSGIKALGKKAFKEELITHKVVVYKPGGTLKVKARINPELFTNTVEIYNDSL